MSSWCTISGSIVTRTWSCHTGRHSCFYRRLVGGAEQGQWEIADPVLKDPKSIYK